MVAVVLELAFRRCSLVCRPATSENPKVTGDDSPWLSTTIEQAIDLECQLSRMQAPPQPRRRRRLRST